MPKSAHTFLMFQGAGADAIELYQSIFPDCVLNMEKYPAESKMAGQILRAELKICDQKFMLFDSEPVHKFTFTPAISIFLTANDEIEFNHLFEQLSSGGGVMMAPSNYGFSQKFAWCADRFGVSWQINLP